MNVEYYTPKNNGVFYNEKQWYLANNGNYSAISECKDYKDFIIMKTGIDIGYNRIEKLLNEKELKNEVIVALIDTGVDFTHKDLNGIMLKGSECYNGDVRASHGTMCAGIIAAKGDSTGIIGIASKANIKIISINIFRDKKSIKPGEIRALVKAINKAESNGAVICNLSLSTEIYSIELEAVIRDSKMLFVVSAGNGMDGGGKRVNIDEIPVYPASFKLPNVITVANINYNGYLNNFSNYGKKSVDIAAPGTCIYSTGRNNTYLYCTGTSMAAPMVTGVAALVYSIVGNLAASEIKRIIINSASKREELFDVISSCGLLNGAEAVEKAMALKDLR